MKTIKSNALVLMVGPSGAGKSTIAAHKFRAENIFESDSIRIELFGTKKRGNLPNELFFDKVFKILNHRIENNIKSGNLTVVDATNLNWKDRKTYVEMATKYNVPIYYVVFNRSLDEKVKTQGWRENCFIGDVSLIEFHHNRFIKNESEILSGDNKKAIVIDARTEDFSVEI